MRGLVSTASIWRRLPIVCWTWAASVKCVRSAENAIQPARREPSVEAVAKRDELPGHPRDQLIAEARDGLIEIGHSAAAELGDENLAGIGSHLAIQFVEDRGRPEILSLQMSTAGFGDPSVRIQS